MFSRHPCPNRPPDQRRRDDVLVLGTSLFTVFVSVFTVLFS